MMNQYDLDKFEIEKMRKATNDLKQMQANFKKYGIYVLDKDNLPRMSYIKTQGEIDGKWVVSSGVKKGDRIVTGGLQKVISGSPVRIVSTIEQTKKTPKKECIINRLINKVKNIFNKK